MSTDVDNTTQGLSEAHLAELIDQSAIRAEVVADRGYRTFPGADTATETAELESLGFNKAQVRREGVFPALLIPLHAPYGEVSTYQLKPATPRKLKDRALKYETPYGAAARIDMPPFTNQAIYPDSIERHLWITEGMKKVDSLVSQGVACIGLTGVYNWRNAMGTLGDWEDIPVKGRPMTICFDADARTNMNVLRAMIRLGRWLKGKGATVRYLIVPEVVGNTPVKGVDDFFAAGGTLAHLESVAATREPDTGTRDGTFTDAFMAETVADEVFEGKCAWTPGMGWIAFDGQIWAQCDESKVVESVRSYAITQFQAVLDGMRKGTGQADGENAIEGWNGMLDGRKMTRVVHLAKGIVAVDDEVLDADRDLLNVQNGVVDLRTGELGPHDPALFMTRVAGAEYHPDASHPAWEAALSAMPEDVREWMRVRAGQAATGYRTSDDVSPILHGAAGSNGKSTWAAGISGALGTYHVLVPDEILTGEAKRDESMMLRGARFALIEETAERAALNTTALKKLSSPELTGKHLYKSTVQFQATHSLMVTTNHRPIVTQTDGGTWRRLALVTFPYRFVDHPTAPNDRPKNPRLIALMEAGDPDVLGAALRWTVDGARSWYDAGRVLPEPPVSVIADTRTWRSETDLILKFWDECLAVDNAAHVIVGDLMAAYNTWRVTQGMKPVSERVFTPEFEGHSESQAARVEKRQVRKGFDGLSRPGMDPDADPFGAPGTSSDLKPVPERYRALLGVRFQ